jgi:hypothetical protein
VLHDDQFHPYHNYRTPRLVPGHRPLGTHLCELLLRRHTADELILNNILWRDESYVTREDMFNVHNSEFWELDNPQVFREHGY